MLYDDDVLYVGARLYDTEPARISRRLTARDEHPDADCVTVFLPDHRTRQYKGVRPGGGAPGASLFRASQGHS